MWEKTDDEMKKKLKKIMNKNINTYILCVNIVFVLGLIVLLIICNSMDGDEEMYEMVLLSFATFYFIVMAYFIISKFFKTLFDSIMYVKGNVEDFTFEKGSYNQYGYFNPDTYYYSIKDQEGNVYKGVALKVNKEWKDKKGIAFKCTKKKAKKGK